MGVQRRLLPLTYVPLRLLNRTRQVVACARHHGRLRVLLFHDVPRDQQAYFKRQLEWLSQSWTFISPGAFAGMISGKVPVARDSLLLTFDDGFHSNRLVAEEVLDPLGIRALFFVCSGFAGLQNRRDQIGFITDRLYPPGGGEDPGIIGPDVKNMSFSDVKFLAESGHTIGTHSATHARLSTTREHHRLVEEIVSSADRLQDRLGVAVEHFAYPFGNVASFSGAALDVARGRFRYIHTGMRGDNSKSLRPWAIRRDTISLDDPLKLVGAFLEGAADWRYRRDIETYESWARN